MCSGAMRLDQYGQLCVIATTADTITFVGHVFVVLDPRPFGLAPEPGRLPTARERASVRPPYTSPRNRWNRPQPVDDDQLDDQAPKAAYVEQRKAPIDLVNVAA